jgi:CheY-like chemotaxis protein
MATTEDPLSFEPLAPAASDHPEKVGILLVDDNPGKLLAHGAVLAELGENVVTASSGTEALQKLLRQDFAVVLLDVNMPGMDGFETAELIRQRPRFERTPIIFVTAYNTTDIDRLRGYKLGAVDYLYLPIVPEVLKAKVKAFADMARQNQVIRRQAEHLAFHNQEQARQLKTIQELNRNLTETNKELESFSYTISHDLRAPLRALKGFSAYLLESCADQLDETARDCAERIHRAATCLDTLTHDLLKYSHIARGERNL